MAKKKQRAAVSAPSPAVLRGRAKKAMGEGRFQQALELAKQAHKAEPTPAHHELVRQAYLGRARQLRVQGQTRDAVTALRAALAFDRVTPTWLGDVAAELARAGEVEEALALAAEAPDAAARITAHAADAAIQQGDVGRAALPEALHADFDRVILAFGQSEAGQDDEARTTLQPVGLRSPFLEWKVLLRGLQAYYGRDDARALENWQRLQAERLPTRLAAPFRFQIDPEFRAAQPPETQAALQRQLDRLEGDGSLLPRLRQMRALMAGRESLAAAFRQAEALLPALRREAPGAVERLASCFYWAAVDTGPDDVIRYKRVFGKPAADPNFFRLEALANEHAGNAEDAHKNWHKYEKDVAADPTAWPAGEAGRVRALVWLRMARNAAAVPGPEELARLPAYLRNDPDRPRPLKPSAEECLRHCLELAPDLLEAHEQLFDLHRRTRRDAKAEAAARRLLEQFPDHLPTLEGLSDLLLARDEYAEALELLRRAWKANPLNRALRAKVAAAHLLTARGLTLADRFDEARQEFEAALNLHDPAEAYTVLARWAACEFRAGRPERAEELIGQAKGRAPALAVSFILLGESIRLKLHRTVKGRFDREFKEGLEAPATPAAAAALAGVARALVRGGVDYHGLKTHVRKVLAYAEKAPAADYTESEMEEVASVFVDLKATRAARRLLDEAVVRFRSNPRFPYLLALTYLAGGLERAPVYQVKPMLEDARRLAEAQPPDARRDQLLRDIREKLTALAAANPFGMGHMPDFFSSFFDDWDEGG